MAADPLTALFDCAAGLVDIAGRHETEQIALRRAVIGCRDRDPTLLYAALATIQMAAELTAEECARLLKKMETAGMIEEEKP